MIVLAATPLGNDDDASPRLRAELEGADLIAAEDTRRLLNLAGRLGITLHGKVVPYHEHNESEVAPQLIEASREGRRVVVVSDAGMPSVSDPGYRLVSLAAGPRTMIFFESPRRLVATLTAMRDELGPDRRAAVCRELTKLY